MAGRAAAHGKPARNYALVLTYIYTGWRSAELLRMRWRDVRPSQSQPGTFILRGGEGREGTGRCAAGAVLSRDCWFLKLAGRWTPGAPGREEGAGAG